MCLLLVNELNNKHIIIGINMELEIVDYTYNGHTGLLIVEFDAVWEDMDYDAHDINGNIGAVSAGKMLTDIKIAAASFNDSDLVHLDTLYDDEDLINDMENMALSQEVY